MAFDEQRYKDNEARKVIARKMVKVPWQVQQFVIELLQHNGRRTDYFQTCVTCAHWCDFIDTSKGEDAEVTQHCGLFHVLPPPKVIADGCQHYKEFDDIPF